MNGTLHTVAAFNRRGDLVLDNGQVVAKSYGHLAHGYCTTSHASQGKTVDRVFVACGPESFAAVSKEQFYVSVSRARESATVYCADKRELREAASRSSARTTATELVATPKQAERPPSRTVRLVEHIRRVTRAALVRQRAGRDDNRKDRDRVAEGDTSRERNR